MPVMRVFIDQESPRIVRVDLTGKLDAKEWRAALAQVAELLRPGEVTPLMVYAMGFEGWGAGNWNDISFQSAFQKEHDPLMGRMAIVAEKRWEDQATMFAGQGFRRMEIK